MFCVSVFLSACLCFYHRIPFFVERILTVNKTRKEKREKTRGSDSLSNDYVFVATVVPFKCRSKVSATTTTTKKNKKNAFIAHLSADDDSRRRKRRESVSGIARSFCPPLRLRCLL